MVVGFKFTQFYVGTYSSESAANNTSLDQWYPMSNNKTTLETRKSSKVTCIKSLKVPVQNS